MRGSAIQCKSSAIELPEVKGEQHLPFCTSIADQTGIAKTLACSPGAKGQKVPYFPMYKSTF